MEGKQQKLVDKWRDLERERERHHEIRNQPLFHHPSIQGVIIIIASTQSTLLLLIPIYPAIKCPPPLVPHPKVRRVTHQPSCNIIHLKCMHYQAYYPHLWRKQELITGFIIYIIKYAYIYMLKLGNNNKCISIKNEDFYFKVIG